MNNIEIDAVLRLPAPIRYEYFIKKAADYEEIWGLFKDGWAVSEDKEGKTLIPFFPRKEFAESLAAKEWAGYRAKRIDLDELINEWLPGMKEDGVRPSIFPIGDDSVVVEIDVLLKDLEAELENY